MGVGNDVEHQRGLAAGLGPEDFHDASAGHSAHSEREIDGVSSSEIRYFIGSASGDAEMYLKWVRGHWGIENSLHWVLDVCFREDEQRHWAGNSAQNLSWLRKVALCLLKAVKNSKGTSINRRRLLAGWKNEFLLSVLAQIPEKSDA